MSTLPTLYSKNANGSVQQWTVSSSPVQEGHSEIFGGVTVEYGQVGGALQTTTEILKEGKNIGKKTETTPVQQAALKAKQLFDKKVKEGYLESYERLMYALFKQPSRRGFFLAQEAYNKCKQAEEAFNEAKTSSPKV